MSLFKRSSGLVQSTLVAVGNVGASGFSAISLIILSRYLGPQSFGGFSVAFSLTQLTARIGDLGLNLSLQRYVAARYQTHPDEAAAAIQLVGKIKLGIAGLSILLGLVIGPLLSQSLFHVSDPLMTTIGVCLAAVIILYEYVVTIAQSIAKFVHSVAINGIQALIKASLAIGSFFLLAPDPRFAYSWYGLAPFVATLIGSSFVTKYFKKQSHHHQVWPDIYRVAQFSFIGVIAAAVGDNIDVLMVNSSLSEYQTGLYSAASRIALMLTLFGLSFGTVFNTRIARYQNKHDLSRYFTKALLFGLASLCLIPVGILLAKPLILLTAGAQFAAAIPAMNYLMASSFIMMAGVPFIAIFYVVDYPAYFAVSGVIQTIILIAGNAVLIPLFGIEGAGIAKLVTRFVIVVYTVIAAYRHARHQYQIEWPTVQMARSVIHE